MTRTARVTTLRSSAGANSRKRPALTSEQTHRAETFAQRVMNGTAKILGRDHTPAPLTHNSGPQHWTVGTFIDEDLEYTVQVLVTRQRDPANPHLLP